MNSFKEAETALQKFVPPAGKLHDNYTLERMYKLMELVGNPQERLKIIHVAGTAGKGSTAYYLSSLLVNAGQKVGLTVSPHVEAINERVQLNLVPLEEKMFCRELTEFLGIVEASDLTPTYFEILVAFAYWVFANQEVDYAVIEVGLGGLLDGTNVADQEDKVCVITDIDFDHMAVLGNSLEEIAYQKAGIIKMGNDVFMHRQGAEVIKVVKDKCDQMNARLHLVEEETHEPKFLPSFQRRNWHLASNVFNWVAERDRLSITARDYQAAARIRIPARFETLVWQDKIIIVDAAHNAAKMGALVRSVKEVYPNKKIACLLSVGENKKATTQKILKELSAACQNIIYTYFKGGQDVERRAISSAEIKSYASALSGANFKLIEDYHQALNELLEQPEEMLLITGSFYLIAKVRPLILRMPVRPL